ncbi:MAG: prepilin peptidase [Oscillospiraceae bacterium]|nr:prepilin peptidase [Oscillospiraceae bacterium]
MHLSYLQFLSIPPCLLALAVSSLYDLKYRRVPNVVTISLMLYGLLLTCLTELPMLPYKLFYAACLFFFGMTGLLGLGDIKLLIGLGVVWGPEYALLSAALASLVIFLHHIIRHRTGLLSLLKRSSLCLLRMRPTQERDSYNSVPFAPYLLFSYILIQGGLLLWQL